MLNNAAKYALGVTVFGLIAAIATADNDIAFFLLLGAALVAGVIAFGEARTVGPDMAPFVAPDAAAISTPVDPADVPRGSIGPMVVGVGATISASGGAMGPRYVLAGGLVALVGIGVWLFDTYRTPGVLDARNAQNVDDRFLGPIAMPVGAFLLAITIAYSFSRVLLAINETASWVVAFIVAAVVLAALWLIAAKVPTTRVVAVLAAIGMAGTLVAGGAGASVGEREFHDLRSRIPTAEIAAKDLAFDRKVIGLPAETDAEIVFDNLDPDFHNVSIYTADEADLPLFSGRPLTAGTEVYKLHTPEVGTYRFVCDFHPTMEGELRVTEAAESSEEEHE